MTKNSFVAEVTFNNMFDELKDVKYFKEITRFNSLIM